MYKDGPRTEKCKTFITAVGNIGIQMKRKDIYDDFKLKKTFGFHGLYQKYFSALRVKRSE